MRHLCCSILLLLTAISGQAAEVYRSVDANGVVVYSDRPEGTQTERVVVATANPTGRVTPAAGADVDGSPDDDSVSETLSGERQRELTPDERAEERSANCTIARQRAEQYANSHRLFRELADGEREYLSDGELNEARTKADSDVATWCD